jgi:hypothetical protein
VSARQQPKQPKARRQISEFDAPQLRSVPDLLAMIEVIEFIVDRQPDACFVSLVLQIQEDVGDLRGCRVELCCAILPNAHER